MIASDYYLISILFLAILQDTLQLPYPRNMFREVDTCECGKPDIAIATRIVGGDVVHSNVYPWMVAIFFNGKMHCGGSLINDRYILTAGHCLNRLNKEDLQLILGETDLQNIPDENRRTETEVEIDSMFVHEDFSSDYLHDMEDIGLIRLKNPVTFTDKINPICLPRLGMDFDKMPAIVTGWGRTDQNGSPSIVLRKADLKVMTNDECRNISSIGDHITDSMLCAYEYETDACQGDSGGPLILEDDGRVEQIGIVSWGIGCAKPGIPGVYTRMTSYMDWLSRNTRDAIYCKNPE